MFEHSVKVPRQYKAAANILKKVCSEAGSLKTLIYDSKHRHFNVKSLYALVTTAVRNARALTSLFSEIQLLEKEPRLDQWLARILAIEILLGKKSLPGHSKPEQTLLRYKEQIQHFPIKHPELFDFKGPRRPRYVRVNTIKMQIDEFIEWFEYEGYELVPCTAASYDDYLQQVRSIEEHQFLQDYHVKYIFAFHTDTKFYDHELYADGKLLLQDKASALAVELLAPERGATILDMCAAPGMKATQLAAYINNDGVINAFERIQNRQETLRNMIDLTGASVRIIGNDVLDAPDDYKEDIEYILLDPSCSGSGMDYCLYDYTKDMDGKKLQQITNVQEQLLRHAVTSYPRAKRIVYSTCSLLPEENEMVVTAVVKTTRGKWQVRPVKELLEGQWNNFGSGPPGSIAARCLYARPDCDFTKGFFLAVIDRNLDDSVDSDPRIVNEKLGKETQMENVEKRHERAEKKDKLKAAKFDDQSSNLQIEDNAKPTNQEDEENSQSHSKTKKKMLNSKNKGKTENSDEKEDTEDNNASEYFINTARASKKQKRGTDDGCQPLNNTTDNCSELVIEESNSIKRRKKKTKNHNMEQADTEDISPNDTNFDEVPKKKKRKNKVAITEVAEEFTSEVVYKKKKNKK